LIPLRIPAILHLFLRNPMAFVIASSDEFDIVEDSSNFVHIMDGEGTVRVSMPREIMDDIVRQIHSRVDFYFYN
jgi:hypothetical protein